VYAFSPTRKEEGRSKDIKKKKAPFGPKKGGEEKGGTD